VAPERSDGARAGIGFGFGLAGLLAAALAYYAADYGLFSGPAWRSTLVAVLIGGSSALVLLAADRAVRALRTPKPGRTARPKGPWACPQCGAAYVPTAVECSDCHVPLAAVKE
jgi:hypothetical protein